MKINAILFSLSLLLLVVPNLHAGSSHQVFNSSDLTSIRAISRDVLNARNQRRLQILNNNAGDRAALEKVRNMIENELNDIKNTAGFDFSSSSIVNLNLKEKVVTFEGGKKSSVSSTHRLATQKALNIPLVSKQEMERREVFNEKVRNLMASTSRIQSMRQTVALKIGSGNQKSRMKAISEEVDANLRKASIMNDVDRHRQLEIMLENWDKPILNSDVEVSTPTLTVRTEHVSQ